MGRGDEAAETGRGNSRIAWYALSVAFFFVLVSRGVIDTWMVFLLPIEQEFNVNRQLTAGVFSTYMLATGLSAPLAGLMLRRFGYRLCYCLGLALIALANFIASRAHGMLELYLCIGILSSIGISAIGVVPASALIGRWFRHRMSVAMGAVYAGLGTGSLLLVPLAQWLIELQGWRATYILMASSVAVLALIALILPWRTLEGGNAEPIVAAGSGGAGSPPEGITLRQAIRCREFIGLFISFGCTGLGMYIVVVQAVPFLIDGGVSPLKAATAYGLCGMLSVGGVIITGWLSDRFGLRPVALASFACTFGGILCLLGLSFGVSEILLASYVACFGIAQGARGPIVATLSNRLFPGPSAAAIYGVIYASSNIGAGGGAWLSGLLHDMTGSYRPALLLAAVIIFSAAMPFAFVRAFRAPQPVQRLT